MAAKKSPAKKPAVRGARSAAIPETKRRPRVVGKSVELYIARVGGWRAEAMATIRKLILATAPATVEGIKWGQPVWEHGGPIAWLRGSAKHLSFGFWRGADMHDPAGILEGDGTRMRHLKISDGSKLDEDAVGHLVHQAVRLNAERGDPTRRS